jgi:hypothetical protein
MAAAEPVAAHIEKIMSIRTAEFEAGITRLDPTAVAAAVAAGGATAYPVRHPTAGSAVVSIRFEAIEPAVLGGLMRLPRARVTLDLGPLDANGRRAFLAAFDQTFQRGGG